MQDYAHPEALVSTDWVAENKDNSDVVVVEVPSPVAGVPTRVTIRIVRHSRATEVLRQAYDCTI